jgi:hypothetical protein
MQDDDRRQQQAKGSGVNADEQPGPGKGSDRDHQHQRPVATDALGPAPSAQDTDDVYRDGRQQNNEHGAADVDQDGQKGSRHQRKPQPEDAMDQSSQEHDRPREYPEQDAQGFKVHKIRGPDLGPAVF